MWSLADKWEQVVWENTLSQRKHLILYFASVLRFLSTNFVRQFPLQNSGSDSYHKELTRVWVVENYMHVKSFIAIVCITGKATPNMEQQFILLYIERHKVDVTPCTHIGRHVGPTYIYICAITCIFINSGTAKHDCTFSRDFKHCLFVSQVSLKYPANQSS